jgi:putative ABC transport system ATP-binding protein
MGQHESNRVKLSVRNLSEALMQVVAAQQLTKVYSTGPGSVGALGGVDFAVSKGEFVAVTGPSGCGKSSLLHLLGGLDVPTSGRVLLEGTDLATLTDDERAILRRRRIGFVFQSFNLLPTLTACENVALPLLLDGVGSAAAAARASQALEAVGLEKRCDHLPSMLSGGEQQRVAVARALVIEPALILADEPTGNLDSTNGRHVVALLRAFVDLQQQTLVMVTHDDAIAGEADRIVHLRDGLVCATTLAASATSPGPPLNSEISDARVRR